MSEPPSEGDILRERETQGARAKVRDDALRIAIERVHLASRWVDGVDDGQTALALHHLTAALVYGQTRGPHVRVGPRRDQRACA